MDVDSLFGALFFAGRIFEGRLSRDIRI